METTEGYARLGRDLLDRLASQVQLDRVVDLRRVQWSGHVFSLMSIEGWHCANSLIVSNCNCTHTPTSRGRAGEFIETPDVHATDLTSLHMAAGDRPQGGRLMPEHILTNTSSRDQAISLLRRLGYLVA